MIKTVFSLSLRLLQLSVSCAVLVFVSGCGNSSDQGEILKSVSGNFAKKSNGAPTDPAKIIAQTLQSTGGPLLLAIVENRGATAVLKPVADNGAYTTWASPDGRSISMINGQLSATRGLGQDLMSVKAEQSQLLIAARKTGRAQRVHRYLDGELQTQALALNCKIQKLGQEQVTFAEFSVRATKMQESCVSASGVTKIANVYMVDEQGRVVQSRQWVSPINQYLTFQTLRY